LGFDAIHQVIRERLNANRGSVPFDGVPNTAFTQPEEGPWGRLVINDGETERIEHPGTYRSAGVMILQIFDEIGKGEGALLELADTLTVVFRRVTVQGVRFEDPSLKRIGNSGDGWYQMNLICRWTADEVVNQ